MWISPHDAMRAPAPSRAARQTLFIWKSNAGFCINARCQVIDMSGEVIPGLHCGGESAGGFSMHGPPRAITQRLIAGRNAVTENM